MKPFPCLLAQLEPSDVITSFQKLDQGTKEALIIIAAIGVLTILIVIWVWWFHKPRRRSHSHHSSHRHHSNGDADAELVPAAAGEDTAEPGRHRRRRRRRDHRPRNPTLAETGGLPPVRTDDQPPAPGT